ncbi:MAG: hypothetical protein U0L79_01840 [Lachnospiraceae bacterium]|nr:hypothetical protein [Lachnospiraceae bacterium]
MELNMITSGVELLGTYVNDLSIDNSIADITKDAKRTFGLNIREPEFETKDGSIYAQIGIEIEIEINQSEEQNCKIRFAIDAGFISLGDIEEEMFKQRVVVNGVAALIGIARGKIETISASIFNSGKIVIPFINVVDYYKSLSK